jgi:parallel beta-helix repeat protein
MRHNKKLGQLVSYTFLLILISPYLIIGSQTHGTPQNSLTRIKAKSDTTTHDPILIIGDSEFADEASVEGWPGNGTPENPYVIEYYDIFGSSSIQIAHTRVHFIIRSCQLEYDTPAAGTSSITLWNVTNAVVRDTVLIGNSMGMYLVDANSTLIVNNTYSGIPGSTEGLAFDHDISGSHSNIIANNTFTDVDVGISVSPTCAGNTIEWNNMIGTTISISDNNPTEVNTFRYNYYEEYGGTDVDEDGIGDSPYVIDPWRTYSDPYPLMYPSMKPQWSDPPIYLSIPFGVALSYDLNVTSSSPVVWWVNNTEFSVDTQGIIESSPDLAVGNYRLMVKVTNIYGRFLLGFFQLVVYDSTPPFWVVSPADQTIIENEAFDYFVIASDKSEFSQWEINPSLLFNITTAKDNEWLLLRIRNITTLAAGIYPLNLTIIDIHSNLLSTTFSLTVIPLEQDTVLPDSTILIVFGVVSVAIIAVVMVVMQFRRK